MILKNDIAILLEDESRRAFQRKDLRRLSLPPPKRDRRHVEGGIGIVHRALPIERQAEMVRFVKRSHSAVIESPHCVPRGTTIGDAKAIARRHQIPALLVEESAGSGTLAGLLTNRDIPRRSELDTQLVDAFMTPFDRLHVSPPGVGEDEAERLMFENRIERLPLVDDGRQIRGLITLRDLLLFRHRPFLSKDTKGRLLVGAAIGVRGDYLERAAALIEARADVIILDIAHAHSEVMKKGVEAVRSRSEGVALICGNVGAYEGARFLADVGVDAIKVGVGPGRGCRTRLETAAGVPQLQAIREAWVRRRR